MTRTGFRPYGSASGNLCSSDAANGNQVFDCRCKHRVHHLTSQTVLVQIVCEELSRARYERQGHDGPEGGGNGYHRIGTVTATLGPRSCAARSSRATSALHDQLFGSGVSWWTNALEVLVINSWVSGPSDRDVEALGGRCSAVMIPV